MRSLIKRFVLSFVLLLSTVTMVFADEEKETFALVLGGGGARGYAHVPVIQELEKRGIVPDYVIGTSMGALIGGFYAAGWTGDELEDLALFDDINGLVKETNLHSGSISFDLPDSDLVSNILIVDMGKDGIGSSSGLLSDQEVNGFIRYNVAKVLDVDDFDDLSIKFRSIASDITHGDKFVFSGGDFFEALRSSMSLPLIFPTMEVDGSFLMDGGLVDIMAANVAKELGATYILAVDVGNTLHANEDRSPAEVNTLTGSFWALEAFPSVMNVKPNYEIATWVLVPDVSDFSTLNFSKADEIMERGEKCVEEHSDIFDFLEEKFGGRSDEFKSYDSIEADTIKGIDASVLGDSYNRYLQRYVGKALDNATLKEMEEVLEAIAKEERIRNINYTVEDGVLKFSTLEYADLLGSVSLGLIGSLGMKYNPKYGAYFAYDPGVSIGFQKDLGSSLISLGIIYDYTLDLEARYALDMSKDSKFFLGGDFEYMNLSYLTDGLMYGSAFKNDLSASFETGFYFEIMHGLKFDVFGAFDYTNLAKTLYESDLAVIQEHGTNEIYLYGGLDLSLLREGIVPIWYQVGMNLDVAFGCDYAFDGFEKLSKRFMMGYSGKINLSTLIGSERVQFSLALEADSIRRYPKLKEAYVTTKGGIITRDYLYGFVGLRSEIAPKWFIEIGSYGEAFEKQLDLIADYYKEEIGPLPFSALGAWAVGGKLKVSRDVSFGEVYFESYMGYSDGPSLSFMVGIGS